MLKHFFVFSLLFAIITTQAMAVTNGGFKSAIDEFTYAMEVEGAATNAEARKMAVQKLHAELEKLNLSNEQLIESALAQVKDPKLASELKASFTQIQTQNLSREQALSAVKSIMDKSKMNGASWNGNAAFPYLFIAGFIALIVVLEILIKGCGDDDYYDAHAKQCDYNAANPPETDSWDDLDYDYDYDFDYYDDYDYDY